MQMRPGHSGSYLIAANRMTPLPDGWSGGVPGDYAREGNPINNQSRKARRTGAAATATRGTRTSATRPGDPSSVAGGAAPSATRS
jgi:hypothetical protein